MRAEVVEGSSYGLLMYLSFSFLNVCFVFFFFRAAPEEVKSHPFFKDINWDTLLEKPGIFVPRTTDIFDTGYFNGVLRTNFSLFSLS